MPIGFLLVFLLSSCSAPAANHQALLDKYAEITQSGGSFAGVLTQSALVQADASQRLLSDLGYTQRGRARFEIWSSSGTLVSGCLDLSEVVIIDSKGAFLNLAERRSQFSATFTSGNLISNFEVSKEKC
jgi:hypothetical protein